ncbi:Thioredoxin domain-containing protein 5, partial [Termitomyces sp. T112]
TGRKWRLRTKGSGLASGREVVWTWMDAEKWKNWMKSMYGIVVKEEDDDLDDVPVVVADHQRLVYYDRDSHNHRLEVSSSKSLFETVEAAAAGKLSYKHSENLVERVARYLNTKMVSLETYVVTYPWRAATFLCMIFVGIFFVLKRWLADDGDYRKVDRLD